jgi:hypothetical protein
MVQDKIEQSCLLCRAASPARFDALNEIKPRALPF